MTLKKVHVLALVLALLGGSPVTRAGNASAPILRITGRIGVTNDAAQKAYTFTFADLQKVGNTSITATTRYTRTARFEGPMIRDLLKAVKAAPDATEVSVVTIDGYQKTIPITDFQKWEVIVAHTQDGRRLTLENKGPLWVMYPTDKYPRELLNNQTTNKLAWSLTGLVVK